MKRGAGARALNLSPLVCPSFSGRRKREPELHFFLRAQHPLLSPFFHLVGRPALVGTKHDGVGRRVNQVLGREALGPVLRHQLHVRAAAGDAVRAQLELVLEGQDRGGGVDRRGERGGDAIVLGGLRDLGREEEEMENGEMEGVG